MKPLPREIGIMRNEETPPILYEEWETAICCKCEQPFNVVIAREDGAPVILIGCKACNIFALAETKLLIMPKKEMR